MKPISYHADARLEVAAAAAYYHRRNPAASRDFLGVLEKPVAQVQAAPHRWPFENGTAAQRRRLTRFPYIIFYLEEPVEIIILAVAHTSRRPGYWKKRIAG